MKQHSFFFLEHTVVQLLWLINTFIHSEFLLIWNSLTRTLDFHRAVTFSIIQELWDQPKSSCCSRRCLAETVQTYIYSTNTFRPPQDIRPSSEKLSWKINLSDISYTVLCCEATKLSPQTAHIPAWEKTARTGQIERLGGICFQADMHWIEL